MLGSFHCSARANSIASLCCGRLEEFLLAHWVDRLWVCLVLLTSGTKKDESIIRFRLN